MRWDLKLEIDSTIVTEYDNESLLYLQLIFSDITKW